MATHRTTNSEIAEVLKMMRVAANLTDLRESTEEAVRLVRALHNEMAKKRGWTSVMGWDRV